MILLIPGPVTTRPEIRAVMSRDYAPWDLDFREQQAAIFAHLAAIAGIDPRTHVLLPLQGCGHFVTEAAIRSLVEPGGGLLIPGTGAYAARMARLAREAGRHVVELPVSPVGTIDPARIIAALEADPALSHVGLVYSETSSGIIHDPVAIGAAARACGRRLILDAVSAFGALPIDFNAQPELDCAVFSVNKCLESLPGIAFAIARTDSLAPGRAGSWSFDLFDLMTHYRRSPGSSRFTPSPQAIIALGQALDFLEAEGGPAARLARYAANRDALYDGILDLGLTPYLARAQQGPIVMNIHAPKNPSWDLQRFVDLMKAGGFVISNFHDTPEPSFRVGCIGAITPDDMRAAVAAMAVALDRLGVTRDALLRGAA